MKKSVDADLNRISADMEYKFIFETVPQQPDDEIIDDDSRQGTRCHPHFAFHKPGKHQYEHHKNRQRDHVGNPYGFDVSKTSGRLCGCMEAFGARKINEEEF